MVGIFGTRNTQDDVPADDGAYTQDQAGQPASVDGMLPQAGTPQDQQYDPYAAAPASVVNDDPSAPPTDYIMTGDQGAPAPHEQPIYPEAPDAPAEPVPVHTVPSAPAPALQKTAPEDLMQIKQQALQQLSPLISHLEQSPEERFRTAMMMLQATDDQTLIKTAYEAAQAITDEKAKAQALLDIVNEINYFSQKNG